MKQRTTATPVVLERDFQRAYSEFLELDDWTYYPMETVYNAKYRKGTGKKGQADGLYIRYHNRYGKHGFAPWKASAEVMWIEFKREVGKKTTKLAPHQDQWHDEHRALGALTLKAGVDFPATIDGAMEWYRNSGLKR